MTVYERMLNVLADLPAIGKDSRAPQAMGGYAFRGIEDITAALKPLLAKHGVFYVPTTLELREEARTTSTGKALYIATVHVQHTFYGADGDALVGSVWGQGSDSGDKAVQKAYTSAMKTSLSETFCISDAAYDAEGHDVPMTIPAASATRRGRGNAGASSPSSQSGNEDAPASKERVHALAERVNAKGLSGWIHDENFSWPWSDAECDIIEAKCDEIP